MKKIILFLSIMTAAGLTMVTVYNSLVDFKSWNSDVPSSILAARDYYKHVDPRNFFNIIAPINQIAVLLTVILFWKSSPPTRVYFISSFIIYAAIGALTALYFIPRDIIIFAKPVEGHVEAIRDALNQWQSMNWLRTGLGLLGLSCTWRGLDLYYKLSQSARHESV